MGSEMHVPTEPKLEEQRMDASGLDPTTGKHARLDKLKHRNWSIVAKFLPIYLILFVLLSDPGLTTIILKGH